MRVRFRYTKLGKLRWTSHRDVARMWERALRRAALPVAYSEGFTPHPRLSFGLALGVGHESVAEYLDVELAAASLDVGAAVVDLSRALPAGVDVVAGGVVPPGESSLQEQVISTSWELEAVGLHEDELRARLDAALASDSLVISRERKGSVVTDDVRPAILGASVVGPSPCVAEGFVAHDPGAVIACELASQPRGLRPAELLRAIEPALTEGHVRRLHQWIERDGAWREPLPAGATDAPHALERAS